VSSATSKAATAPKSAASSQANTKTDPASEGSAPSKITSENNLREKLMKRKRELKKKLEGTVAPAAKKAAIVNDAETPTPIQVAAPSSEQKTSKQPASEATPAETSKVAKINETGKELNKKAELSVDLKSDIQLEAKATESASTETKGKNENISAFESSKDNDTSKKTTVFGSGQTLVFGSGQTPAFGSGLNPGAKSFAFGSGSGFGISKSDTSSSTTSGSGAFLNLKPPGPGQSTPLVFGSSTNIQLPTPSKTPVFDASPFGTGGASPFGTFGTVASNTTKKRGREPETEDAAADSVSSKMTRVETSTGNKGEKSESIKLDGEKEAAESDKNIEDEEKESFAS